MGVGTLAGIPILLGRVVANRRRWTERDRDEVARDAVAAGRRRSPVSSTTWSPMRWGSWWSRPGREAVLDRDRAAAAGAFQRIEDAGAGTRGDAPTTGRPADRSERPGAVAAARVGASGGAPRDPARSGPSRGGNGSRGPAPQPPGADFAAYRVMQEAVTNTLRHAGAARARVATPLVTGRWRSRSPTTGEALRRKERCPVAVWSGCASA